MRLTCGWTTCDGRTLDFNSEDGAWRALDRITDAGQARKLGWRVVKVEAQGGRIVIYFIYLMLAATGSLVLAMAWFTIGAWRDRGWRYGLEWFGRFVIALVLHGSFWIMRATQLRIDGWR